MLERERERGRREGEERCMATSVRNHCIYSSQAQNIHVYITHLVLSKADFKIINRLANSVVEFFHSEIKSARINTIPTTALLI